MDATKKATGFFVHAGPWSYRVRVASGGLVDDAGNPAWAIYDAAAFEILLCADLPRSMRIAKIAHEMVHVYECVFGCPRTEEERARRMEVIAEQLRRDIRRQGGESIIENLEPGD